jgi:hypothetical protein
MPILLASTETSASYVSAGVAALAILASLVTTFLTLRHQRALAEEERVSKNRADAYIRLLEYQHKNPRFEGLLPAEIAARFLAHGSEEANRALDTVRKARGDEAFKKAIDGLLTQIRFELQGKKDSEPLNPVDRWQTEDTT